VTRVLRFYTIAIRSRCGEAATPVSGNREHRRHTTMASLYPMLHRFVRVDLVVAGSRTLRADGGVKGRLKLALSGLAATGRF